MLHSFYNKEPVKKIRKRILIVLAGIVVLVILSFICVRHAWRLENAKYGLKTTVIHNSSTGATFEVECSGKKGTDSLYIENEDGFYLDKWTIGGWESVEYLDERGNIAIYLENYYIDESVTHEVVVGWKLTYGELFSGTYRVKLPIYKDNKAPQKHELIGYCYAVFEV